MDAQGGASACVHPTCLPSMIEARTAQASHFNMCYVGLRGGIYQFDPELGPPQVFARFFGTANPYEALDGEYKSHILLLALPPGMTCSLALTLTRPSACLPSNTAISAQFEAMTTQDPPKKGKNKVVSTKPQSNLHSLWLLLARMPLRATFVAKHTEAFH